MVYSYLPKYHVPPRRTCSPISEGRFRK